MSYKLRNDVILEEVSGIHLLVALRSAWDDCPFALQIASISAHIWQCMKTEMSETEIIDNLISSRQLSMEKAKKTLDSFIRTAKHFHYFLLEESTE